MLSVITFTTRAEEPNPAEPPFERGADYIQNELHISRTGLRAMCVAAHPDDEDGGTLSYMRRVLGAETHTVFSTRGEGGQNEIGPQLGADLAVLRTHEIEEACKILGTKPWFLNLPDFGFSKSADATLAKWGHDEALRRLVRIIRIVRPHILFTNHDANGNDHGHHVATGRLVVEGFDAAADAEKFKDDMEKDGTKPWSVSKLYVRHFAPPGTTLTFDISQRIPLIGMSPADVAAYALTKHASQGMQFTRKVGERELRHFTLVKSRVERKGDEKSMVDGMEFAKPDTEDSTDLKLSSFKLDATSDKLPPGSRRHLENACIEWLGLKSVANVSEPIAAPDEPITITCRVANNGTVPLQLYRWRLVTESSDWDRADGMPHQVLAPSESFEFTVTTRASASAYPTFPKAEYIFSRIESRTPLQLLLEYSVEVNGQPNSFSDTISVPVDLAAPLTMKLRPDPVLLFDDPDHGDEFSLLGKFTLSVTNNQRVAGPEPLTYYAGIKPVAEAPVDNPAEFKFHEKGETLAQQFKFMASSEKLNKGDVLVPLNVWTEKKNFGGPVAHLRRVPLKLPAPLAVALVKSTGDDVWNALKTLEATGLGLTATQLSDDDLRSLDLNRFHTLVIDIRATQYRPVVRSVKERLLQFMKDGGNVVCLYQKDFDWNAPDKDHPARGTGFFKGQGGGGEIAPYPIELSFKRVTNPDAEVRILKPDHPLLTVPCKIGASDFQGWVQERAVYMPVKWADQFTPLLSSNDPGEAPLDGGLLVADVELGSFIYTSYVWHRELRAGVPGAYRFLANLISYPRVRKGASK